MAPDCVACPLFFDKIGKISLICRNKQNVAATTGYGYDDDGRDRLEQVYADVFHAPAALVRPQITCGTQ